ncbi:MAG TPA: hypothetical protein VFY09_03665 [Flavobacteriaceae bacterium]|nr:hypothetical protein [Flavobacteriaceae bacterium]HEX5742982.1 hypothetical protein [Flavobacteriaceae bacterium]
MNIYVVVADTSQVYQDLKIKMIDLREKLNIEIDTMGRGYDLKKDLICLPENDQDEMYAGDYFPRRFPSKTISIEYLSLYNRESGEKSIGIIVGIFDNKNKAENSLKKLKDFTNGAYIIKANIYRGCLH